MNSGFELTPSDGTYWNKPRFKADQHSRVIAQAVGVHGIYSSERMDLGKTSVRAYTSHHVTVLRRTRELMDGGYQVRKAIEIAELEAEIESEEQAALDDE